MLLLNSGCQWWEGTRWPYLCLSLSTMGTCNSQSEKHFGIYYSKVCTITGTSCESNTASSISSTKQFIATIHSHTSYSKRLIESCKYSKDPCQKSMQRVKKKQTRIYLNLEIGLKMTVQLKATSQPKSTYVHMHSPGTETTGQCGRGSGTLGVVAKGENMRDICNSDNNQS